MKRLRPVEFHIQSVVMLDNGETLTPVRIDTVVVPAAEIAAFADRFAGEMAGQEEKINSAEPA